MISGARQVGKNTLCIKIEEELGFGYISLADPLVQLSAREDPSEFLSLHPAPYIINEIIKSYKNNHKDTETSFYYYRTYDKDEIDLVILHDGKLSHIECKSGETYNKADANKFYKFAKTKFILDKKAIICTTHILYSLGDECFVLPISAI